MGLQLRLFGANNATALSKAMDTHVKKVCQSVYYNIQNRNSFRRTLDDKSASILVHAFVLSQLDIGNAQDSVQYYETKS